MNTPPRSRASTLYLFIILAVVAVLWYSYAGKSGEPTPLYINQVAADLHAGKITRMVVKSTTVEVIYKDGTKRSANIEPGEGFLRQLRDLGVPATDLAPDRVKLDFQPPSIWPDIFTGLMYVLPIILVVAMFWYLMRQSQGGGGGALAFGKSRARMFTGDRPMVTFDDVAGVDEAKEELQEVVEFLKEPEKFLALGARIPKGVLLVGPPGTGKTLLAKAVAGEAGVPFFSISGSEFVEMFVGVGASRVRDLFDQAKRHSPCIVFVDEIDAVGRQRGAGLGGSHDEREQTLNQLLVEMDGFDSDTNIIVMAATNRPDILDPALLRPGRFDRRVVLDRPDMRGREAILKVHVRGKPISPEVDLKVLARSTPGFVGADLENLVNEAAILAARRGSKVVEQQDFEEAIERVIAGPQRKSRVINEDEKRIVAYHEAGHAVVMQALPEADPVHKVSIIARGMAGGYTLTLPEEDRTLMSRRKVFADMVGLMGGRAAEELVFDDITSGASNDLERVTRLARTMVTRWGMSDSLGPLVYGKKEELVFLGREIAEQRDYSETIAEQIDAEVRRLVNEAYAQAKSLLQKYREKLDAVAQQLLEKETLSREEFEAIFPPPVPKRATPRPKGSNA